MSSVAKAAHSWSYWFAMWLCVAPTAAQDLPALDNPYARPEPQATKVPVHASFARAVLDKVGACFREEQGRPLNEAERALLEEYRGDVARDLLPALRTTGCEPGKAATGACSSAIAALDCALLAAPIVQAGWDRNLTPEAKAQVALYAESLAAREAACAQQADEEARIALGVRKDRLAALVESEIVIGKCELLPSEQSACDAELARLGCEDIAQRNEQGQLTHACGTLLRCTDAPAPP